MKLNELQPSESDEEEGSADWELSRHDDWISSWVSSERQPGGIVYVWLQADVPTAEMRVRGVAVDDDEWRPLRPMAELLDEYGELTAETAASDDGSLLAETAVLEAGRWVVDFRLTKHGEIFLLLGLAFRVPG